MRRSRPDLNEFLRPDRSAYSTGRSFASVVIPPSAGLRRTGDDAGALTLSGAPRRQVGGLSLMFLKTAGARNRAQRVEFLALR